MKHYLILILLVLVTFANSLKNTFAWDDYQIIVNNPNINLSLKEIPLVFINPLWKMAGSEESVQIYYRPILLLFYSLNYKIFGFNPLGFHIANILLHLIITIVIYRIGLILFNNNLVSLIGSSFFAIHPLNNEPVGRVGSGEVIFGFFLILSIYFFLKEKKLISWALFILALFSKEASVMLPFALVILEIHRNGFKRGIVGIIPYLILAGIYFILRAMIVDTVFGIKTGVPIFAHVLTIIVATFDYIRLLIIPYNLSPYYPMRWYTSVFEIKVIIAIITLTLVCILAFKVRKDRTIFFLLLFPFIMLAPVIWKANTFPIGTEFAYITERFLYVPLMLFSLFVSASIVRLTVMLKKQYLMLIWIIVIMIFSVATISFNMIWEDNFTLFSKIAEDSPTVADAHNNLGNEYLAHRRLKEATNEYLIAIRLKPGFALAYYYNLGNAYALQDKFDDAIKEYLTAIKLKPNYAGAHYNLGLVYKEKGLNEEAEKEFETALKINPNYSDAHNSLGAVYYKKGNMDNAIKEFQEVIRLSPVFPLAYYNLFNAFAKKADKEGALKYYNKFIEHASDKTFEPYKAKAKKVLQELQYEPK